MFCMARAKACWTDASGHGRPRREVARAEYGRAGVARIEHEELLLARHTPLEHERLVDAPRGDQVHPERICAPTQCAERPYDRKDDEQRYAYPHRLRNAREHEQRYHQDGAPVGRHRPLLPFENLYFWSHEGPTRVFFIVDSMKRNAALGEWKRWVEAALGEWVEAALGEWKRWVEAALGKATGSNRPRQLLERSVSMLRRSRSGVHDVVLWTDGDRSDI